MERMHETPKPPAPEYWKPRPEMPFEKGFFELQFDFARTLAERSNKPVFEMIESVAPMVNNYTQSYEAHGARARIEGVTEENIVDTAYSNFLKTVSTVPVPYNDRDRFGCFSHTYDVSRKTAYIHFTNAEYDETGPLSSEKIKQREHEMADVLRNIKRKHPEAENMENRSWLFNIEAFRRLFPETYLGRIEMNDDPALWRLGTVIWGQFLDNKLNIKRNLAETLLERAKNPETDPKEPSSLLVPPLFKPVYVEGPISDFYSKYGIE